MANIKLKDSLPRIITKLNKVLEQSHKNEGESTKKTSRSVVQTQANSKLDKLTQNQLNIIHSIPFTGNEENQIRNLHTGSKYLGEVFLQSTVTDNQVSAEIKKISVIVPTVGDIVEVIRETTTPNLLEYITCTYQQNNEWSLGIKKGVHLKTIGANAYTVSDTDANFLKKSNVFIDDTELQVLENMQINTIGG